MMPLKILVLLVLLSALIPFFLVVAIAILPVCFMVCGYGWAWGNSDDELGLL